MRATSLLVAAVLCFAAFAVASKQFVDIAGSSVNAHQWQKSGSKPASTEEITLGFALKHKNLDLFDKIFWSITDPKSEEYGNHMSNEQMASLIGASDDTIAAVKTWLSSHNAKSTKVSETGDYIWATLRVSDIESLLSVSLSLYSHESASQQKRAFITRTTDTPSVPSAFSQEIDFISGLWHFPATGSLFKKPSELLRNQIINRQVRDEKTVSDGSDITPEILQVTGGPSSILIYFEPVCSEGNATESFNPPCADYNNPIVSYNATTTQFDPKKGKVVTTSQILDNTHINCTIETSLFGSLLYCILSVPNLVNDYYVNGTLSYTFQDKTTTQTAIVAGYDMKEPVVPSALLGPDDVRAHYGVPANATGGNAKNAQAVAAFIFQFFNPADLSQFFKEFDLPAYTVQKIIGPNDPPFPGVEASLDIQYIMGIAQGVNTWFWSMTGNSWIAEWGQAVLNTPNAPWVHSISYGEGEANVLPAYLARSETELKKLGAAGHSVMIASGDSGTGGVCQEYTPDWPTSSPYVTSVGATRISAIATPACQTNPGGSGCSEVGEVGVSGDLGLFWSTGAGFSNANSRPSYQDDAVANYLKTAPLPPAGYFNSTGRAYPDVAAVGHNLLVVDAGVVQPVDGTSAASPIFAGLVSLLNERRIVAGKKPLGFLNPWLYGLLSSNPSAFYDVTVGDTTYCEEQQCCADESFVAIKGWDIVSGCGTPNFPVLLKEALKLA